MCGIVAILAYGSSAPPVDERELVKIRDAMRVRGPDGAGAWISADRRVGLAHRRLSIIDTTQAGAQPMATDDGALRIVFNGEIYNYQSLRERLERRGFAFRSSSDTEVLLHLWADRGPAMMDELRGMYAFAIWDDTRKLLFLARDPFGIKPLYFADDGRTVRAASQVKALLGAGTVDTSSDPAAQAGFLLWGYVPEPHTMARGVRALAAGSTMCIDLQGHKPVRNFFSLRDELAAAEARVADAPLGDAELRERLRGALTASVARHLVADVPVGVFLSAGLDSATITALAAEISGADLHTITLGFAEFSGTANDETILAATVAQRFGTRHETRWVGRGEFDTQFERMLAAMDQPSIDGANTYFVSLAAAQSGLKAVLSGLGGDELFGGYASFSQIPRLVNLAGKIGWAHLGRAARIIAAPLLRRITSAKYAGLLEYGGSYGGAYLLRRGLFMPWELPALLGPDVARAGWRELEPMLALESTVGGIHSARLRVSALEMSWYMRNQLLRDSDWAGMAHSVEIRVPLVDLDLLRAVAPLAAHLHGKREMAETPRKPLPDGVRERAKTGFATPMREWLGGEPGVPNGKSLRRWALFLAGQFGITVQPNSAALIGG